jgi:hypothetical protein
MVATKIVAQFKKVNHAMQFLLKNWNVMVHEVMHVVELKVFLGLKVFLVMYEFGMHNANGKLKFEARATSCIINMDKMCIFLDGNNGNTSKLELTSTMISGSSATVEPIPPYLQFQTLVNMVKSEAIRIK